MNGKAVKLNKPAWNRSSWERIEREIKREGGVSVDAARGEPVELGNTWCFPKYPGKTKIVSANCNLREELTGFIAENRKLLAEKGSWLGIWLNPDTNHYYFDITTTCADLEMAKKQAKEVSLRDGRKIVTIYNPGMKKLEYLWENVRK